MDDAEAQREAEMATDAAWTAAEEADGTAEAAQRAVEIAEQARARRNLHLREARRNLPKQQGVIVRTLLRGRREEGGVVDCSRLMMRVMMVGVHL